MTTALVLFDDVFDSHDRIESFSALSESVGSVFVSPVFIFVFLLPFFHQVSVYLDTLRIIG